MHNQLRALVGFGREARPLRGAADSYSGSQSDATLPWAPGRRARLWALVAEGRCRPCRHLNGLMAGLPKATGPGLRSRFGVGGSAALRRSAGGEASAGAWLEVAAVN